MSTEHEQLIYLVARRHIGLGHVEEQTARRNISRS